MKKLLGLLFVSALYFGYQTEAKAEQKWIRTDIHNEKSIFRTVSEDYKLFRGTELFTKGVESSVDLDGNGKKETVKVSVAKDVLVTIDGKTLTLPMEGDVADYFKAANPKVRYQLDFLDLQKTGKKLVMLSAANIEKLTSILYIWADFNGKYEYVGSIAGREFFYFDTMNEEIKTSYWYKESDFAYKNYREAYQIKDNQITQVFPKW